MEIKNVNGLYLIKVAESDTVDSIKEELNKLPNGIEINAEIPFDGDFMNFDNNFVCALRDINKDFTIKTDFYNVNYEESSFDNELNEEKEEDTKMTIKLNDLERFAESVNKYRLNISVEDFMSGDFKNKIHKFINGVPKGLFVNIGVTLELYKLIEENYKCKEMILDEIDKYKDYYFVIVDTIKG